MRVPDEGDEELVVDMDEIDERTDEKNLIRV
jgi:hypothetical protein